MSLIREKEAKDVEQTISSLSFATENGAHLGKHCCFPNQWPWGFSGEVGPPLSVSGACWVGFLPHGLCCPGGCAELTGCSSSEEVISLLSNCCQSRRACLTLQSLSLAAPHLPVLPSALFSLFPLHCFTCDRFDSGLLSELSENFEHHQHFCEQPPSFMQHHVCVYTCAYV